ncbi:MAG: outer membrane lipoprotein-sorting protein [Pseudomonadota bacterium]
MTGRATSAAVALRSWTNKQTVFLSSLLCCASLAVCAAASAQLRDDWEALPAPKAGLAIMAAVDEADSGFGDLRVQLRMVLRTRAGQESERALRIAQLEMANDGDRLMVVFETPRAIRGTALLSHAHLDREDDQWLFLPAFNRTRKIASRNRSGPFVSSEFAFEDLTQPPLAKFTYSYLGKQPCGQAVCLAVERIPMDRYSGYSRQVVRVHPLYLRIEEIDYYNRAGVLLKTLTQSGFERYEERFWRPAQMVMVNHLTGKSTRLEWRDYRFRSGLSAQRDFSVASLERQR